MQTGRRRHNPADAIRIDFTAKEVRNILARLTRFAETLKKEEFPLDAKPAKVIDLVQAPAESGADGKGAAATGGRTLPAPEEVAPGPRCDLVTSVSAMLAEKGRLAEIARELKPVGKHDDEFGRFARQAIQFIDSLDRIVELAREQAEADERLEGWSQSVEALYKRMLRLFENYDLKVMSCVGQPVDLNVHDVIEYRRTRDYPHNTVIQEIGKGIVFRDKVIRDAKVVVACNEDEAAREAS